MLKYDHLILDIRLPYITDHSPLVMDMQLQLTNIKTLFRFFSRWTQHDTFTIIVQRSWQSRLIGNALKCVWQKLKNLKQPLRQLNNKEYGGVTEKIESIRDALTNIQQQLTSSYLDGCAKDEKELPLQLEKWYGI